MALLRLRCFRALIIVGIVAAGLLAGLWLGPRQQKVQADFYIDLLRSLQLPAFDKAGSESEVHRLKVNGQNMFYSIHSTDKPIDKLFDDYREHILKRDMEKLEQLGKEYGAVQMAPEYQKVLDPVRPYLQILISDNIIQQNNNEWGFLFALTKNLSDQNSLPDLRARWEKFLQTGNLGVLGVANTLIAFREPGAKQTGYMRLWTGPDFNLLKLLPSEGEDPPGKEMPDMPGPDGARRFLSVEEMNDQAGSVTNCYLVRGRSVDRVRSDVTSRLRAAGWSQGLPEDLIPKGGEYSAVYFQKKGSFATFSFIRKDDEVFYIASRKFE